MNIDFKSHVPEIEAAIKEGIETGLEACGLAAEGYAKEEFTKNGPYPYGTGNLRNSIAHKVVPDENAVYIGTDVEYGPYIEFGTGHYSTTGGGTTKSSWVYQDSQGKFHRAFPQPARPYLKPAVSNNVDEYKEILEKYLTIAINK